jgi:WD40 repeat protein
MTKNIIGQQWGKYQLVRLLGRGDFAEVYLGQHVELPMQAAIKVLHAHLSNEKSKQFQEEAKIAIKLAHPHIVSILDFGVLQNVPFLVMDYCPNGTLRQRHPKGERVPLLTVVSYVKQIAEALQYAHNQKHIHHNVKPENMLIGQDDDILLSDFGIAATAHNTFFMNRQAFVGTPPYMAPEQIKLHRRRESDQYALAIVIYEWLAGKLPFLGTPEEIATKHLSAKPPSLCQKFSDLPIQVEKVVFKALAKDQKERFPSVQDFAIALEEASQAMQAISVLAQPKTISSQTLQAPEATISTLPETADQTLTKEVDIPEALPPTTTTDVADTSTLTEEADSSPITTIDEADSSPITTIDEADSSPLTTIDEADSSPLTTIDEIDSSPITTIDEIDSSPITTIDETDSSPLTTIDETDSSPAPRLSAIPVVSETNTHAEAQSATVTALPDTNSLSEESDPSPLTVVPNTNSLIEESNSPNLTAIPDTKSPTEESNPTPLTTIPDTPPLTEEFDLGPLTTISNNHSHAQPQSAKVSTTTATNSWAEEPNLATLTITPKAKTKTNLQSSANTLPAPKKTSLLRSLPGQKLTRRKVLIGLAAAGLLVVADGAIIWGIVGSHSSSSNPLLRYTYTGHIWTVYTVAWALGGKRIASGGSDNTIQVWNATDGSNAYSYQGHSDTVYSVAWSPDGARIASGSNDKTVQVWNAMDGGNAYSYHGHSSTVYAVAWSPDGTLIASASADNTVQVWNSSGKNQVYTYRGHKGPVYTLAWSPDGKRIASGGRDDTIQAWDATTGNNVSTFHGHSDAVNTVAWSPDGTLIASGGFDNTVRVWSPTMQGNVYVYQGHSSTINALAWSFDGKRIASASNDKTVQVWNSADGSNAYAYHGHTNIVETVGWSPNGGELASGSWDGTVQVWQAP